MKRKVIAVIAAAAMCMTAMTGCGGGNEQKVEESSEKQEQSNGEAADTKQTDAEASGDNIVVVADTQSPTSLDLAQSWDSWYTTRWGITETLYKLDENLEPCPFLAESCEMKDDTTWEIVLRDDVTFQNGNQMTAESVKLCWERTAEINARFNEVLFIDSMEADGQNLTVTTSKPVPAFLNGLCEPLTGIIDVADGDPATAPVGTGPFKAVSYAEKSKCVVEKYADYWGGEPKADGAVINIIGDTNTLSLAQQNGESDISVSMPGSALELFADTSKYNADGVPGSRGQILYFNYSNPVLQEKAVREAISMAIDKESYASVINKGASVAATGLYPDFMAFGADEGYKYDMEAAAKVLDDAGVVDSDGDGIREVNGQNISLRLVTYSTKAELPLYANEISSSAAELGIEIKVEVYESVADQQKTGDFDILMVSMTMCPTGDPQYFANITLKSGGSGNYGGYGNAEVDKKIEELEVEFDPEKRVELAKEIQKLVIDDAGFIVIGHNKYYYVMGANVKGLHTNPSEYYLLDKDVYVE